MPRTAESPRRSSLRRRGRRCCLTILHTYLQKRHSRGRNQKDRNLKSQRLLIHFYLNRSQTKGTIRITDRHALFSHPVKSYKKCKKKYPSFYKTLRFCKKYAIIFLTAKTGCSCFLSKSCLNRGRRYGYRL